MTVLQVIIIYLAATIDSNLLLMRKGSTCRKLSTSQHFLYPLLCAITSAIVIVIGHLLSQLFNTEVLNTFNLFISGMILLGLGIYLIWKGRSEKAPAERLDETLDMKQIFKLALYMNIDCLFVAMCMGIEKVPLWESLAVGVALNYGASIAGLEYGYHNGYFGRWMPVVGGFVMLAIGVYFTINFVL